LHLHVHGEEGGYVELKVDSTTFALQKLVVVEEEAPPPSDSPIEIPTDSFEYLAQIFDLDLWEWKIMPDYAEPASRESDVDLGLGSSRNEDFIALWFDNDPTARFLGCGDVKVGVSADGAMTCAITPVPTTHEEAGYPGASA